MIKKFNNIFIIDDDVASQFVCERVFELLDVANKLLFFENGKDALNYFDKTLKNIDVNKPNLILLDLDMPVMDGFEFIKSIKKHKVYNYNITIAILATTSSHSTKVQSVKTLGVKYYISKPMNLEKMKEFCCHIESSESENFLFID